MEFKKILTYALIGFILSGIFFGTILYFTLWRTSDETVKKVETFEYQAGEFTTNLSNLRSYFKGQIVIETTNKKLLQKLEAKNTILRDEIIKTLLGKKAEDILDPQGQQRLRKELIDAISRIVESDQITNVYFVDYIIQ